MVWNIYAEKDREIEKINVLIAVQVWIALTEVTTCDDFIRPSPG